MRRKNNVHMQKYPHDHTFLISHCEAYGAIEMKRH